MGLRNFQHFCKVDVPNSFRIVSILEELEKYKSATGKDPVIIINLKLIISQFQVNSRDVLCGNRMNKIKPKMEYFFSTLQEAGAKLIFPVVKMTPNVTEEKDVHWIKKIEHEYEKSMYIIDNISSSTSLDQIADIYDAIKRKFGYGRKRFFKVANFVAGYRYPLPFSDLQDIARSILGQNQPSRRNFISELQKGLRVYNESDSTENHFEGILDNALHKGNSFAFEFLMGSKISLVPAYTASNFPGIKTIQDLITQIMRKSAGILMKDYEDKKLEVSVVVKNPDGEFVDRKYEVIWPEFDVPGIAEMLNGDITDDFKIKTLIYLTDLEVSEDLLKSAPDNQLMVLITLTYLIKNDSLTKSEALMILKVLHAEKMQIIEENIQYPEIINVRGFHVTILILNFFRYFQFCLNAIGYKKQKFEFDFDAVYYQNLLANISDNDLEVSTDVSDFKIFEELTNYCKSLE